MIRSWLNHFKHLIYPPLCVSCGVMRPLDRHIFCLECLHELPETGYHKHVINPFVNHFRGRVPIETGAAFLYFSRGSGTQRLLHQIKYSNRPDLITMIGHWYGKQLRQETLWQTPDLILPVPLHWKKQRKRGYNQSAVFGRALGEMLNIPCDKNGLKRTTHDPSLTGMNRLERVGTIRHSFAVRNADRVKGRHVLLADDVLTTGATLESCANVLIRSGVSSIHMVTIACGEL